MAVRTRLDPINRDIQLMVNETLSPAAQSKIISDYAAEQIEEAKQIDRSILGRTPRYTTTVDGRAGSPLESVRPNGSIITEFELFDDVLSWIGDQLRQNSPVGGAGDPHSGLYRESHTLLADGAEVPIGAPVPPADEYVFINTQPYARKIEMGRSSQAPDGVYQVVATLAARRFGNIAKIRFGYRVPLFGAIDAWANTSSAARHAAAHSRSATGRAEWLRRQPAIIVRQG